MLVLALVGALLGRAGAQDEPKRAQIVWLRDVATALSMAQKEHRLVVLFFYGDAQSDADGKKHQRDIEELFKKPKLKDAAKECFGVRVSCHTYPKDARKYGVTKGPFVVILNPKGEAIRSTSDVREEYLGDLVGRLAWEHAPKPVDWKPTVDMAANDVRAKRGLVLLYVHDAEARTLAKAEQMLMDRRLVSARQRVACVRVEKKDAAEAAKRYGVTSYPSVVLLRPGKAGEPAKPLAAKAWPASAQQLAALLEEELRKIDRPNP